jgi:sugar phosphate isomerase/epimerase
MSMQIAICHYSFHRSHDAQGWSVDRFAQEVAALGVKGIDFHANFVGPVEGAADLILAALAKHDLVLAGMSLANNFNLPDPEELRGQIEASKQWIRVAGQVKAPVARIFGGAIAHPERRDAAVRASHRPQILDALRQVVPEAEKQGVILGLENHGGLPCTAEEQVSLIREIDSPWFKATVDVGNYMQAGQEAHEATRTAMEHAAYVHFKDLSKNPDDSSPWGWREGKCPYVGTGAVDHAACLEAMKDAGYKGFVALEYEGTEDESTGVKKSIEFMTDVMQKCGVL